MNIANPIYDEVFKQLMSNTRIAKFFIGTILDETVTELELNSQETAYKKENRDIEGNKISVAIFRLDFVATIKTETGESKKVLIEIQKSRRYSDIMRFRNYLGEQYKKTDDQITETGIKQVALPIVTIYLLGFPLQIEAPAIKVNREYINLLTNEIIHKKDEFIEKLTHTCYIVQVPRIEGRIQTKLDRLLSLFEQNYFIDEKKIIKEYNYPIEGEEMKLMTNVLQLACATPENRKLIESEQEAYREFYSALDENELAFVKTIKEKEKALEEKNKDIEEKNKALEEKNKTLEEKNKDIEEKNKDLAEKNKDIEEKNKYIEEKNKYIKQKEKTIEQKEKTIEQKEKTIEQKEKTIEQKEKTIEQMAEEIQSLKRMLSENNK